MQLGNFDGSCAVAAFPPRVEGVGFQRPFLRRAGRVIPFGVFPMVWVGGEVAGLVSMLGFTSRQLVRGG